MSDIIVVTNTLGDLGTNCYTVVNTKNREAVIIDPAAGAPFLINMVRNQSYDLKAVLLTHGHFDHMAAVPELKKAFPDVPVYIGEDDVDILGSASANLSAMFSSRPLSLTADKTVKDGDILEFTGFSFKIIAVPGHTRGGVCYYLEAEKMLFDGDTLFCRSIGRSDFPTGDGELLLKSIKEKLFTLPDDTTVYPGHEMRTTIGAEKKGNFFFI